MWKVNVAGRGTVHFPADQLRSPPPPPQEGSPPHPHGLPPPSRPAGVSLVTLSFRDFQAELHSRHVHADVVLDVRRWFDDPDKHRFGRGHTGMHSQILTRIVGNHRFHSWFMESIRRIREAALQVGRDNRDVGVVVYCHAGKHRSVACSIILAVSLPTFGFAVAGLMHLTKPSWPTRDCQGGCVDCRNAFDTAHRLSTEHQLVDLSRQ